MEWSKCLVCAVHFEDDVTNWKNSGSGDGKNIAKVFHQILQLFSKYFPLTLMEDVDSPFNFEDDLVLPFCHSCREDVVQMCRAHAQLEAILGKMLKITAKIVQKIMEANLNNFKDRQKSPENNPSCSSPVNLKCRDKLVKLNQKISIFHRTIKQHFTPSLILRNCENYSKNSNKTLIISTSANLETNGNLNEKEHNIQLNSQSTSPKTNSIGSKNNDESAKNFKDNNFNSHTEEDGNHVDDDETFFPQENYYNEDDEEVVVVMDTAESEKTHPEPNLIKEPPLPRRGLTLMDQIRKKLVDPTILSYYDEEEDSGYFPNGTRIMAKDPKKQLVWVNLGLFGVDFGDENVYTCYVCSATFRKPQAAKLHLLQCKNRKGSMSIIRRSIQTVLLMKEGQVKFLYKKHWTISQVAKNVFTCDSCQDVFKTFNKVKTHITNRHERSGMCRNPVVAAGRGNFLFYDKPFQQLEPSSLGYKCISCDLQCPSLTSMKFHLKSCDKADTDKLYCTFCDDDDVKMIRTLPDLKKHWTKKHPDLQINYGVVDCGNDIWLCDGGWLCRRLREKGADEGSQNVSCLICGHVVHGGIEELRKHNRDHHPEGTHPSAIQNKVISQCSDCGQKFCGPSSLLNHLNSGACSRLQLKAGTRKLRCTVCDKELGPLGKLKDHYMRNHPEKNLNFQLTDCGGGIWLCDGQWLFQHAANREVEVLDGIEEESQKVFTCILCTLVIHTTENDCLNRLREHTEKHPSCMCETCGRIFKDSGSLLRHQAIHFETLVGPALGQSPQDGSADENSAGKEKFVYSVQMGLYYEKYGGDNSGGGGEFKCCHCEFLAEDHRQMRRHIQSTHTKTHKKRYAKQQQAELLTPYTGRRRACIVKSADGRRLYNGQWAYDQMVDGRWKCGTCEITRTEQRDLVRHLRYFHEEGTNDWICETCGKSFRNSKRLQVHQLTHSDVRAYTCDQCGASFKTKKYLYQHIKGAHGTKFLTCEKCPQTFRTRQCLQVHQSAHSELQNWQCSECPKKFKRNTSMARHKKAAHGPEKPYACPECPMRFTQCQSVHRHVKVVHSEVRKAQGGAPKVRKDRSTTKSGE